MENPKDLLIHSDCRPGSLKYLNRSLNEAPNMPKPMSVGINNNSNMLLFNKPALHFLSDTMVKNSHHNANTMLMANTN